ncbi:hypothetical protein [Methylobacterium marchantiae]|uniref:Uncharacterized protein n=1 Tax=Methylobacterium marchantiae TaxID=600331 RepID=A0ABW3X7A9_9HYPH
MGNESSDYIDELRRKIKSSEFGFLIADDVLEGVLQNGYGHVLLPPVAPPFPMQWDGYSGSMERILDEIEAEEDLWVRALMLLNSRVDGKCERSRRLILSVAGELGVGLVLQGRLYPPDPKKPKTYPPWWPGHVEKHSIPLKDYGNLFDDFGIDTSADKL